MDSCIVAAAAWTAVEGKVHPIHDEGRACLSAKFGLNSSHRVSDDMQRRGRDVTGRLGSSCVALHGANRAWFAASVRALWPELAQCPPKASPDTYARDFKAPTRPSSSGPTVHPSYTSCSRSSEAGARGATAPSSPTPSLPSYFPEPSRNSATTPTPNQRHAADRTSPPFTSAFRSSTAQEQAPEDCTRLHSFRALTCKDAGQGLVEHALSRRCVCTYAKIRGSRRQAHDSRPTERSRQRFQAQSTDLSWAAEEEPAAWS